MAKGSKNAVPMAKGSKKGGGKAKGCRTKKTAVTKVVLVKPETAKEMEVLKKHAVRLKKESPSDWPEDAVPNVRSCTPLPEGWHHAMKVTGKSCRGSGGILRRCYIGPGGLVKWHKYDLEKHLGVKIETGHEQGKRFVSPLVFDDFPEDTIIRRAECQNGCEYMVKRCDGLDGKTVSDALYSYKYKSGSSADSVQYTVSDLRYDIKGGRIKLETGASNPASQPVKKEQEAKKPRISTKIARPCKTRTITRSSPSATSSLQPPSSSKACLQHIKDTVFKPLLSRAAKGTTGESDIYTMLGVGHQLKMDQLMLNVLPDVLRKSPAERGSFGEGVLSQFAEEIDKCL